MSKDRETIEREEYEETRHLIEKISSAIDNKRCYPEMMRDFCRVYTLFGEQLLRDAEGISALEKDLKMIKLFEISEPEKEALRAIIEGAVASKKGEYEKGIASLMAMQEYIEGLEKSAKRN